MPSSAASGPQPMSLYSEPGARRDELRAAARAAQSRRSVAFRVTVPSAGTVTSSKTSGS